MLLKRILPFFTLSALLFLSCGSISSFESPNSFRNIEAVLYLRNGKSYSGRLLIENFNAFGRPVRLYTEGDTRPMQFNLDEVKGYRIKKDLYDLKEAKGGLRMGKEMLFMKRLTPESSRIHLYEHLKKINGNSKGYAAIKSRHEIDYYMQIPDEEEATVYSLGDPRFVPNFDEKMSQIVKDCPSLAKKIEAKKSGYFYAQVTLLKERKLDVLMNIIDEYNRCK